MDFDVIILLEVLLIAGVSLLNVNCDVVHLAPKLSSDTATANNKIKKLNFTKLIFRITLVRN